MFNKILAAIFIVLRRGFRKVKEQELRKNCSVHPSASFGRMENIDIVGNVFIGANTYINSGQICTGKNSKVVIGEWCALGYNVNLIATTHDIMQPTGDEGERPIIEKDIIIGNRVWIGSNVFIKEGVVIGDDVIVGANSVVTKDVPSKTIVGGVPAKFLRSK